VVRAYANLFTALDQYHTDVQSLTCGCRACPSKTRSLRRAATRRIDEGFERLEQALGQRG
jgi:Fe-S cluster biogenesis protein NfuA